MYHWTDSDVGAIIDLVARSTSSTESADEPLAQLLQELSRMLRAKEWMLEIGQSELSDSQPVWNCCKSTLSPKTELAHFHCAAAAANRLASNLEFAQSGVPVGADHCKVVTSQCQCHGRSVAHPLIRCSWSSAPGKVWSLEYCRSAGTAAFTERDRAILRVLAGQVEQVASDSAGVITGTIQRMTCHRVSVKSSTYCSPARTASKSQPI